MLSILWYVGQDWTFIKLRMAVKCPEDGKGGFSELEPPCSLLLCYSSITENAWCFNLIFFPLYWPLSLSPSLLLIYVLMILLSAIGCQWERNYNVWSFCSSFVLPLSIHSLDDAGMTDYKQDWKCWCVYYDFISCSLWPEMAHQNQRKNRFCV